MMISLQTWMSRMRGKKRKDHRCNVDECSCATVKPEEKWEEGTKSDLRIWEQNVKEGGGQDMAHLEEIKSNTRRGVFVWWLKLEANSSSCDTQWQRKGVVSMLNAQGEKERRVRERDEHWGEIKDGEFKSWRTKGGVNETHQHDRAITGGVKVSKILEISHLNMFNPFHDTEVYLQALIISRVVQKRQSGAL